MMGDSSGGEANVVAPSPQRPSVLRVPPLPSLVESRNEAIDLVETALQVTSRNLTRPVLVSGDSFSDEEAVSVQSSDSTSESDVVVVNRPPEEYEPVEIIDVVDGANSGNIRVVIDIDNDSELLSVGRSTPDLSSGRSTPDLDEEPSEQDFNIDENEDEDDGSEETDEGSRRTIGENIRPATPYPDMARPGSTVSMESSRAGSPYQLPTEHPIITAANVSRVSPNNELATTEPNPALHDNECVSDTQPTKRRRVMSPEKPKSDTTEKQVEEEEDEGCPICFEMWTSSGSHRLVSLKCGHLFGHSCIDKWLRGQGGKCPQCNAKALRKEIRFLYSKTVKAVDTTDRDRAVKELEKEKEMRRRTELEAAQSRLNHQLLVEENSRLKKDLERLRQEMQSFSKSRGTAGIGATQRFDLSQPAAKMGVNAPSAGLSGQFVMDRSIKIWDGGNCRVLAYSPSLATLVVSQPSASPLFPGFGVKKLSTMDFKSSQYVTIHLKAIRDLSFHPQVEDGILISCSLDKKVNMTSVISNTVIHRFEAPFPVWSCVWNTDDSHYFYAGLVNGTVLEYDVRNTASHVREINTEGSKSPVVSLKYVPEDQNANFRPGGLLVGQLDRISFYEKQQEGQQRLHILPLEGSLTSLYFEPITRHVLASFRPTAKHVTIRHQLCELTCTNINPSSSVKSSVCSCTVLHTFYGGRTQTLLSKTILFSHPDDKNTLLVCAGDEASNAIKVWDAATGNLKQHLMTAGAVVDICAIRTCNKLYLAALTDKHLNLLRWS